MAGSARSNSTRRALTFSTSHVDSDRNNCSRCTAACWAPTTGSVPARQVSVLLRSRGSSNPARHSRNPVRPLTVAIQSPFGAIAASLTYMVCSKEAVISPVSRSQTRSALPLEERSRWPFGAIATVPTSATCLDSVAVISPVARSQSCTVKPLVAAIHRPSGAIATDLTSCEWGRAAVDWPIARSQRRTVRPLTVANQLPSDAIASPSQTSTDPAGLFPPHRDALRCPQPYAHKQPRQANQGADRSRSWRSSDLYRPLARSAPLSMPAGIPETAALKRGGPCQRHGSDEGQLHGSVAGNSSRSAPLVGE